jgi:glucuronate isomerase
MTRNFIHDDFLLETAYAQKLFHDYAENLPIIDYHCHLPVDEIAANKRFANITRVWLNGDHYKWRAMRANGVNERYITGGATDWEKFGKWAETVPYTLRNPLFHWTHLELRKPFGITDRLLNKQTAREIWEHCNALLAQDNFSTRGLIQQFNVEALCSTDDPVDSLEYHKSLAKSDFPVLVLPTFRPDKGMMIENPGTFYPWFEKLQEVTGHSITTFARTDAVFQIMVWIRLMPKIIPRLKLKKYLQR